MALFVHAVVTERLMPGSECRERRPFRIQSQQIAGRYQPHGSDERRQSTVKHLTDSRQRSV